MTKNKPQIEEIGSFIKEPVPEVPDKEVNKWLCWCCGKEKCNCVSSECEDCKVCLVCCRCKPN